VSEETRPDTDEIDDLVAGRIDHYHRLQEEGFPTRFDRTHTASELHELHADLPPGTDTDEKVAVAGRVMLRRSFGKLLFLTLADQSGTISSSSTGGRSARRASRQPPRSTSATGWEPPARS
jgi:lysyl-tRNA synthetase, class II